MKRLITVMLAIVLCMSMFVGCTKPNGTVTPEEPPVQENPPVEQTTPPEGARHVFSLAEARAYNWITHAEVEAIAVVHNATVDSVPQVQALSEQAEPLTQRSLTAGQKREIGKEWKARMEEVGDEPAASYSSYYVTANYVRIRSFEVCLVEPGGYGTVRKEQECLIDGVSFYYDDHLKGTEIVLWTEGALVPMEEMSFVDAYEAEWLSYEDLLLHAYRANTGALKNSVAELDEVTENSLREAIAAGVRDESPTIGVEDITITVYYGQLSGCYLIRSKKTHEGIGGMPSSEWELDGIRFRSGRCAVYRVKPKEIKFQTKTLSDKVDFIFGQGPYDENLNPVSGKIPQILQCASNRNELYRACDDLSGDWDIYPWELYDEAFFQEHIVVVYAEKMPYRAEQYGIKEIKATDGLIEITVLDAKTNMESTDPFREDCYFAVLIELDKQDIGEADRAIRIIS